MEGLEVKQWMAINREVYKIYGEEDLNAMCYEFLDKLGDFIDFDGADFWSSSNENTYVFKKRASYRSHTSDVISVEEIPELVDVINNKRCIVFRETDITGKEAWKKTLNYEMYYKPNKWNYGMKLIVAFEGELLGMVSLYRYSYKKDFDVKDVLMLDMFKDHLALRLKKEKAKDSVKKTDNIVTVVSLNKTAEKYELTKKERVVLEKLSHGDSAQKISGELNVSVNTVKKHTVNIYKKLGISRRMQLFSVLVS